METIINAGSVETDTDIRDIEDDFIELLAEIRLRWDHRHLSFSEKFSKGQERGFCPFFAAFFWHAKQFAHAESPMRQDFPSFWKYVNI